MARRAPALPLIGGGRTRFQPIDIDDATGVFLAALGAPSSRGCSYALAGPEVYSLRELIELMLATIGLRRLLVPIPFRAAEALALLEILSDPPLTREQVPSSRPTRSREGAIFCRARSASSRSRSRRSCPAIWSGSADPRHR